MPTILALGTSPHGAESVHPATPYVDYLAMAQRWARKKGYRAD